jgi:preprotein translocase SecE subunit
MALNTPTSENVLARAPEPVARREHAARHNPVFQFIREARTELRKVVWPTREESIRLTAIVIGVSVGTGLLLGGWDYAISQGFQLLAH